MALRFIRPWQVALAWVLHNRAVKSAIVGVHSTNQLKELLLATRLALPKYDLDQLDDATVVEKIRVAPEIAHRRSIADDLVLT